MPHRANRPLATTSLPSSTATSKDPPCAVLPSPTHADSRATPSGNGGVVGTASDWSSYHRDAVSVRARRDASVAYGSEWSLLSLGCLLGAKFTVWLHDETYHIFSCAPGPLLLALDYAGGVFAPYTGASGGASPASSPPPTALCRRCHSAILVLLHPCCCCCRHNWHEVHCRPMWCGARSAR